MLKELKGASAGEKITASYFIHTDVLFWRPCLDD